MDDTRRITQAKLVFIFMYDYVLSNRRYFLKNIVISMIIVGYVLMLHYPRIVMYGLIVAPQEHTEADYAVSITVNGTSVEDVIDTVNGLISMCGVDPGSYGYSVELRYNDGGRRLTIILMDRPETARYMVAYPVVGRFSASGDEVAVAAVNDMGVGRGDVIRIGGYEFRVVGEVFVNPIHSPVFQGINADAVIGIYDGVMKEFVVDAFRGSGRYHVVILLEASREQVRGCVAMLKSDDRVVEVSGVVNIEESLRHDREVYYNDYGSGTSWSVVSYAASVVLVLYMVKVALTDVNEKMRETIALLYSMGASDLVVASILALKFIVISLTSIALGLLVSGWYMRTGLDTPLSMGLLVGNLSSLVVAAVAVGMLASILAGVVGARRVSLVEVLNGA